MQAVRKILEAHGYDAASQLAVGDHLNVEVPGYMPLVIEKISDHRLSVAHYYTQMGDLMSDPEIVFHIRGDEWVPIEYTQHPHIHQHNEHGIPGVAAFVKRWSRNLHQQGFVEAARKAATAAHEVTA